MARLEVRPVTSDTWRDFEALFEAKGSPHYCFCTPYRVRGDLDSAKKKRVMARLVKAKAPIGVLAYDGERPIGWCSVAPRETYVKLERSRTMPRVTPEGSPAWIVLCFFVARDHRGRGVMRALLRGAVAYARKSGAHFVEGYPFDTAGISSTHRGHSSVFEAEGFTQEGKRWARIVGGSELKA
jgi:GNAT superfamily N-acetyltransferase